jgi:phosphopantothenoylcysteine synthetase/decarboxylase
MKILVTAGNTHAPIDKVRCITNVFTGRTGAALAVEAVRRGHETELLTSHPEVIADVNASAIRDARLRITAYRTFDDLRRLLECHVRGGEYHAILHAAAVSDYVSAGVYSLAPATAFDPITNEVHGRFADQSAGKVKSDAEELWLRLVRAPKLVDLFREPWGFTGTLVKFKLEVDKPDAELLAIAERSRLQSRADYMVANTLEGAADWAFVGPAQGDYRRVARAELAGRVLDLIERPTGK